MDYKKDVEDDARDFILHHEDMFKEAIKEGKDFDRNDIDHLDSAFHEGITDRSYSVQDAAFIIENCEQEETDKGLWEGLDTREALSAQAAYSYSNDVWFKAEEIYNELKERFEEEKVSAIEKLDVSVEPDDAESLIDIDAILTTVWNEFESEGKIQPVNPDSEEALELLKEWLNLNAKAGLWGGYPLGGSYIDARCGTGQGMPEVKDFVDFDHEVSAKLPNMHGKYKTSVIAEVKRLTELLHKKSAVKSISTASRTGQWEKGDIGDDYIRLVTHRKDDKKSFFEAHQYHTKGSRRYLHTAVMEMKDDDLRNLRDYLNRLPL